eukprot:2681350-Rhodomonas_salina.4
MEDRGGAAGSTCSLSMWSAASSQRATIQPCTRLDAGAYQLVAAIPRADMVAHTATHGPPGQLSGGKTTSADQ